MIYSKHNIFSTIRDSDNYFIVNLLSGNADLLSKDEAAQIEVARKGSITPDSPFFRELVEKGYWVSEEVEDRRYREKYLDFLDARESDEVQIFYVPNYSCNFSCTYCYQDQYNNPKQLLSFEIIDAFFQYIQSEFANRRKYITVFGGEPLLNTPHQKELITYLLKQASEENLEVCFVTNGYSLVDYMEVFKQGHIREIQVTLDGTEEVHNQRRFLKGGAGSFENIVKGIDHCLQNEIMVNLRMVMDKENISNLPDFASFVIDKGWTRSPWFKSQIGRNYELHHCQSAYEKLFDRISLYENIFALTQQHPHILEFYKPAYSVAKFLSEQGELPEPLFDACPACKTEWAFDYTGHIFPCTATVGKSDESLGTYFPKVTKREEQILNWETRDITSIQECQSCSVQLACGGGCGSVAKNKSGSLCTTDCRPIASLLELGYAAYFSDDEKGYLIDK